MSTKNKKSAGTGVRYSDAQKKEILDFVAQYNSTKGRGGQSAAVKKFKVTPLTIAAWMKAAGIKAGSKTKAAKAAKAPKAPKAAKAPKVSKAGKSKASVNSKKGMRYSLEQKQEVIDFVNAYNAAKGRGGQNQAAKKFNLSVLTVSAWLKAAGVKAPKGAKAPAPAKVAKPAVSAAPSAVGLSAKVTSLLQLGDQIRKVETELQSLRGRYDALSASIRSSI